MEAQILRIAVAIAGTLEEGLVEGPSPEERRQFLRPVFPEKPLPEGIRLWRLDPFHLMPHVIQDAVPAIGFPFRLLVCLEEGPQVYKAMLHKQ